MTQEAPRKSRRAVPPVVLTEPDPDLATPARPRRARQAKATTTEPVRELTDTELLENLLKHLTWSDVSFSLPDDPDHWYIKLEGEQVPADLAAAFRRRFS